MSIDSDQINYLVYRYLQESGFQHSSFTFAHESGILKSSLVSLKIPPGALIAQLQRSLYYLQAEVNLTEEGLPAEAEDLETIEPLTLIEAVQPEVCEQRRQQLRARIRETQRQSVGENGEEAERGAMEVDYEIPADRIHVLKGHTNEVIVCAWNPKFELFATGSSDSTARIWSLEEDAEPIILRHLSVDGSESKNVSAVDWNAAGTLLATAAADCTVRIWTKTGDLQNRLLGHNGPLLEVKWNAASDMLVSTCLDGSAAVWDAATGARRQLFTLYSDPCVDVSWQSANTFAICSLEPVLYVCQTNEMAPLKALRGHTTEVNVLCWDPTATLLASASDDTTVRIWDAAQDEPIHVLRHGDKVLTVAWAAGPRTLLASASADAVVKIWDVSAGKCVYTLCGHTAALNSVDFDPTGRFLVTAGADGNVLVWSLQTGALQQIYRSSSGGTIFKARFSPAGNRILACSSDHSVVLLDFKA